MTDSFELRELVLGDVLARQAGRRGDKVFLTELATGRTWTYRQLDAWSDRVAQALRAAGAEKGMHVGVLMGNSAEHLALFFAIGKLGAVSVPVNTAARGDLLRYYFDHADARFVVADEDLAPRLAEVLPQLPLVQRVLVAGRHGEPAAPASLLALGAAAEDLSACIAAAPSGKPGTPVKCSDLLMLCFTSGTTGPSKASMLPHAAALTYGTSAAQAQGYRESDVFYVCLPLFHNNALLASMAAALVCGGSVVLSERFSVSRFLAEIRASGATITNFLGAMSEFLWSQPAGPDDRNHALRLVSMSPTPRHAAQFEERFGLRVMSNYGLSDFGTVTAFVPGSAPPAKLGSIGKARAVFELKVVDDDDFECPRGVVGELVIRAKEPWRAATGYYKMPEQTLAAHRNQWFHTGDRAYEDADGYFWFVDRKKDCIRRRGENISAFEVEQALLTHPQVANAAVFPVATPENDEEVGACIVLREGATVDEAGLVAHCAANMAYFMVPRYIQLLPELPTTVNQKVEKFKLKQALDADVSQAWDREQAGIKLQR